MSFAASMSTFQKLVFSGTFRHESPRKCSLPLSQVELFSEYLVSSSLDPTVIFQHSTRLRRTVSLTKTACSEILQLYGERMKRQHCRVLTTQESYRINHCYWQSKIQTFRSKSNRVACGFQMTLSPAVFRSHLLKRILFATCWFYFSNFSYSDIFWNCLLKLRLRRQMFPQRLTAASHQGRHHCRTVARQTSIGVLYVCARGLEVRKTDNIPLIYSASYFNFGGA